MLNQVVLVGRIKEINEGGLILKCQRPFKNEKGEYDYDLIPVEFYGGVAENTNKYCKEEDIIGVKGRIAKLDNENFRVVAEKVSFLSSRREEDE